MEADEGCQLRALKTADRLDYDENQMTSVLFPLFVVLLQDVPPALRPEDLASVAGKVVNKLTREPVKHADITLRAADFAAETVKSGVDGAFAVDQLRPGRYTIEARKNGYTVPRRKPGVAADFVVLEKGSKKTGHTIELLPQAAISGRVTDENGEPVANATVSVESVHGLRPQQGMSRPFQTNDRGEYRLFGLEPGRFRVRAAPLPSMNFEQPNRNAKPARVKSEAAPSTSTEGLVPVYFPAATSAEQAAVVELAAGDEREGLDIQMVKARVFEVSGKVIPPAGWSSDKRQMMGNVYLISTKYMQFNMGGNGMIDGTGKFVIKSVAPGAYVLMANLMNARSAGRLRIEVLGGDLTNVEVQFHSPVTIAGTVRMPEKMDPVRLRLMLNSADAMGGGAAQSFVDAKGAFKLENVTPDTMSLRVMGTDPTAYVQSVRLDGQDVDLDALPIKPGEGAQLEVTIAANGGTVEGTVRLANDAEHEGAAIALWPNVEATAPLKPSLIRIIRAGPKGKFQIQGVRPGKYVLAAFDNLMPTGPSGAPEEEILRSARSKATAIVIDAGSKLTQDLKSLGEPE